MKTLTETLDNGKARTIRVSWNGNSFDVYKQTPEKDAFVFLVPIIQLPTDERL